MANLGALGAALKAGGSIVGRAGTAAGEIASRKAAKEKEENKLRQALANEVQLLTALKDEGDPDAGRLLELTEKFKRPFSTGEKKQFSNVFAGQRTEDESLADELAQKLASGTIGGAENLGLSEQDIQPLLQAGGLGGADLTRIFETLPGAGRDIGRLAEESALAGETAKLGRTQAVKAAVAPAKPKPKSPIQRGVDSAVTLISKNRRLAEEGLDPSGKPLVGKVDKLMTMPQLIKQTKVDLISNANELWRKLSPDQRGDIDIENISTLSDLNFVVDGLGEGLAFELLNAIVVTHGTVGGSRWKKRVRPLLRRGAKLPEGPLLEPTTGTPANVSVEEAIAELKVRGKQ